MPRSMADPNYVYKPWTPEQRKAMSDAHRRRLGLEPGQRLLYGVVVSDELHALLSAPIHKARAKGKPLGEIRYALKLLRALLEG